MSENELQCFRKLNGLGLIFWPPKYSMFKLCHSLRKRWERQRLTLAKVTCDDYETCFKKSNRGVALRLNSRLKVGRGGKPTAIFISPSSTTRTEETRAPYFSQLVLLASVDTSTKWFPFFRTGAKQFQRQQWARIFQIATWQHPLENSFPWSTFLTTRPKSIHLQGEKVSVRWRWRLKFSIKSIFFQIHNPTNWYSDRSAPY